MKIDLIHLPKREAYRFMTRVIIPRPIAWISSIDEQGCSNLAPFSYFMGISSSPPMVGVSIAFDHQGNRKDTARNISDTGEFVINFVNKENYESMNLTAARYSAEIDEFEVSNLTREKSDLVRPFRVGESPVNLECRLVDIYEPPGVKGEVFIGKILLVHIKDQFIKDGLPDMEKLKAVGRLGDSQYAFIGDIIKLPVPRS